MQPLGESDFCDSVTYSLILKCNSTKVERHYKFYKDVH